MSKTPSAFDLTVNEVNNTIERALRDSINPNANDSVRGCFRHIVEWAKAGYLLANAEEWQKSRDEWRAKAMCYERQLNDAGLTPGATRKDV